jgi:DNA-binding XRE family transcriptional regulator
MMTTRGLPGLASARETRGISRAALADILKLPEQQLARWETGDASPPLWVAIAVAQVVGASVEHLRRVPS